MEFLIPASVLVVATGLAVTLVVQVKDFLVELWNDL